MKLHVKRLMLWGRDLRGDVRMAMVVKNNAAAIKSLNILDKNAKQLAKSLQQASSGMRINSAGDGASE